MLSTALWSLRSDSPRLFFLSDHELSTILSETYNDLPALQKFFEKHLQYNFKANPVSTDTTPEEVDKAMALAREAAGVYVRSRTTKPVEMRGIFKTTSGKWVSYQSYCLYFILHYSRVPNTVSSLAPIISVCK